MEGSASRAEPSTLKPEIVEGSILQARTLHAEARNCGRFHSSESNPPRFRPESRTVRCKQNQPSTRRLDITDGPCLRSAPSMLMPHIADGSIPQTRTFHETAPHHGRFILQSGTIHAEARNRGRFHFPDPNPPRKRPASWKVQRPERNHPRWSPKPWTVPFRRPEPSTKTRRIMEGSASRAEPSTLKPEIVEGSISQARTLHENAAHHGRFSIQSGTLRAEARNRGRFHSAGPNPPRKRRTSWKVQCPERNHPC